jgi:hypothetical protein
MRSDGDNRRAVGHNNGSVRQNSNRVTLNGTVSQSSTIGAGGRDQADLG